MGEVRVIERQILELSHRIISAVGRSEVNSIETVNRIGRIIDLCIFNCGINIV